MRSKNVILALLAPMLATLMMVGILRAVNLLNTKLTLDTRVMTLLFFLLTFGFMQQGFRLPNESGSAALCMVSVGLCFTFALVFLISSLTAALAMDSRLGPSIWIIGLVLGAIETYAFFALAYGKVPKDSVALQAHRVLYPGETYRAQLHFGDSSVIFIKTQLTITIEDIPVSCTDFTGKLSLVAKVNLDVDKAKQRGVKELDLPDVIRGTADKIKQYNTYFVASKTLRTFLKDLKAQSLDGNIKDFPFQATVERILPLTV